MPRNVFDTEKYTCDRCGMDHKKSSLKKQRGLWLSADCFDQIDRIQPPRTRWTSPRDNSTTVTTPAESVPEVFTISSGTGINQLSQSNELSERRDGPHKSIFMKIVSDGGAINISADPQIIPGLQGDILTLRGTSDTDTVQLDDSDTLHLNSNRIPRIVLGDGDAITLVYNLFDDSGGDIGGWGTSGWGSTGYGFGGATEGWVEASRFKGGV